MKNDRKSIRPNPIQCEAIRTNPNQSHRIDPSRIFNQNKSERIRGQNDSDWFWLKIRFGSIRARMDSDWKLSLGLVRIHSECCLGLGRIDFLPFFIKRVTKRFSDWFGMFRFGSDTDVGMNRNSSDWLGMNSYPLLSPGKIFDWINQNFVGSTKFLLYGQQNFWLIRQNYFIDSTNSFVNNIWMIQLNILVIFN